MVATRNATGTASAVDVEDEMSYKVHCDRCNNAWATLGQRDFPEGWRKVVLDFDTDSPWKSDVLHVCPVCYQDVSAYLKGAQ